ncbi:MAG: hypothetical protein QW379_07465 [Thermoplasmata archaeon]
MLVLGLGVTVVALALAGVTGGPETKPYALPGGKKAELTSVQTSFAGQGSENSETQFSVVINDTNLVEVIVTLTWQDEAASRIGLTNEPDTLGVTVSSPEGESRSDSGNSGSVSVRFAFNVTEDTALKKPSKRGMGTWDVVVEVGACGDQEPFIPDPLGLRTVADTGNAFTLTIVYNYYKIVAASGVS